MKSKYSVEKSRNVHSQVMPVQPVFSRSQDSVFPDRRVANLFSPPVLKPPGPEVIKLFSCSTQLSTKFFLLINVKMPLIVGILTFMSGKISILGLFQPKKANFLYIFLYL